MFDIEITEDALEDIDVFRPFERNQIFDGIERCLKYEPDVVNRNVKKLRPNVLANYELRLGNFRVFYEVDPGVSLVRVVAIGKKNHNKLLIRNQEKQI